MCTRSVLPGTCGRGCALNPMHFKCESGRLHRPLSETRVNEQVASSNGNCLRSKVLRGSVVIHADYLCERVWGDKC